MIPLVITAKNEEKGIRECLASIINSVVNIERTQPITFNITVVLDDCTDKTESIVQSFDRVRILVSSGGIVAAQRKAVESIKFDFIIFSDADIHVEEKALLSITDAMFNNSSLCIAYPTKHPVKPQRNTLLAKALYTYNKTNGFQTKRHYFNGRLFAIRNWYIPTTESLNARIKKLLNCRFYCFEDGIRTDDIFLSRHALATQGRGSIKEVTEGAVHYRPPETYQGMYRTYRRMRMEIERINQLLPDTQETHHRSGIRKYDRKAIKSAKKMDRFYWYLFRFTLQICKLHYVAERTWYQHFVNRNCPAWETIEESKNPIFIE